MNGGANAFGPGNRANATIGRAMRLMLLNVGGALRRRSRQVHAGQPGEVHLRHLRERGGEPLRALSCRDRASGPRTDGLRLAAESPHSVTDHQCNDPEGILDTICSAMSTSPTTTPCRRAIARWPWAPSMRGHRRQWLDPARHPPLPAGCIRQSFRRHRDHRYGKVYNRNLPKWYKRDPDAASRSCRAPTTSTCSSSAAMPGGSPPSFPAGGICTRRCAKPVDAADGARARTVPMAPAAI